MRQRRHRVCREFGPVLTPEEQGRALDVDPKLCFLCQEEPPTHLCRSSNGEFNLCEGCANFSNAEARRREQVVRALCRNDRTKIFQYALGVDPTARHSFQIVAKLGQGEAKP